MSFFEELKRRNVFRVGIAYLIGAWLLAQIAELLLDTFNAPDWTMQFIVVVLMIGFPLALFFAWAFEMTPDGVKRDADVDRSSSVSVQTGRKLDRAIIVILVAALAYFIWESRFGANDTPVSEPLDKRAQTEQTAPTQQSAASSDKSVAVLPFLNMSSDPEQEYFSDGITEEIINALVKIPGLSVPARTSVFAFKGDHRDIRGIGQELGVAHVLEGSIRSQNNQVRITAQLIKVDDGFHLWSDTFDRELSNIFKVQEEIAGAISQVLIGELGLADSAVPNQTREMDAYDLYLQGRDILRGRGRSLANFDLAISLFETVTKIDPDFAPGWAALAITYQVSDYVTKTGVLTQEKAIEVANHALSLDPQNVEAMTAIASAMRDTWRWEEAGRYFERAIAIDPESPELLEDYAEFHGMTGNLEQYLAVGEKGFAIDSRLEPLRDVYFSALVANGRSEEALEKLHANGPLTSDGEWDQVAPLLALGRTEDAINALKNMKDKGERELHMIGLLENPGDSIAKDKLRAELSPEKLGTYIGTNINPHVVLSLAGDVEFAIDSMIALRERLGWGNIEGIWSPQYSLIRKHERWEEFLELVKLPEYWDQAGWPDMCARTDNGRIVCQ
jgi:TolB-like protein